MQWMDIETPEWEVPVIVWNGQEVAPAYFEGAWFHERGRYADPPDPVWPVPTRWQPLPAPPLSGEQ